MSAAEHTALKEPSSGDTILEINDLMVEFALEKSRLTAVDGISAKFRAGRTTGIVGESGCGKSVTAFSIMRLIPHPPGKIGRGAIWYEGKDLLTVSIDEMRKIRGKQIAMIFQEPMTALNPVQTILKQMEEVYELHHDYTAAERQEKCVEMLVRVGIPAPKRRMLDYPHYLSGGMRQRVMIGMALSLTPKILIADEPTTALDVTIQAQILALMNDLKEEQRMSTIFITHDLGVVAQMCDDVLVMYAGMIIEQATVFELFKNPQHPYTRGLLDSVPRRGVGRHQKLSTIEGMVPDLSQPQTGCRFYARCKYKKSRCQSEVPVLNASDNSSSRAVACHFPLG